jgi:hypothetical protein
MAKGKSSAGFWVLISTLLVGGGVGIYFLLRKPKSEDGKSEDGKSEEEKKAELEKPKDDVPSTSSSSNTNVAPKSFTFPFKSVDEGNTFRAWVIKKDPTFAKSIDLGATGKLNSYVQKAWDKYGVEYAGVLAQSGIKGAYAQGQTSKDIDTIIKFATGKKADKSYLSISIPMFVTAWAKAIRNEKSTFIWANQVYRTKTGDKVLDYDPTYRIYYAKITGQIAKQSADDNALASTVTKGTKLGSPKAITYNNGLWFYYPDNPRSIFGFKWFKIDYLTRTKPSSSFSGGEEEIWAGFDNNFDITMK